jgi:hypothetical protein
MKNSNDTIGNRTRDLPAYSAVPQLTAPPRAYYTHTIRRQNAEMSLLNLTVYILTTKLYRVLIQQYK